MKADKSTSSHVIPVIGPSGPPAAPEHEYHLMLPRADASNELVLEVPSTLARLHT